MSIRTIATAAALLAGLGGAGTANAQGGFGPEELEIDHVRDNIYMIRSAASGNITVFVSDDGVLLVDSKFEREYDRYMELLRTVTDQPVRFVVNTHMHGDHTGGNIRLEGLDANIVATENARRRLAATQSMGLPNVTFDDHTRLYFAGKPLDLYWLGRGHTDGDLVMHLPEDGIVLTGDLFAGFGPSIRLIDYNGGGSLFEWSGTLERVLELDFDTVIPGHSGVTDRATLQGYLDETIRMQEMLREMHGAGRAPDEIQAAITSEFGRLAFFVLPGIESALAELP
ncbi:MAG: MBL fold metallo-hydrolase [Gammaproteobacteria bacterium]|nr:MBL fold metallo-hydrolase [Gammaproteobacteria bacterium]